MAPFGKVMYISESISDSMNANSTSNPCISHPNTAARCMMMQKEMYFAVGAQVSSQSTPWIWEQPHPTKRTRYLSVPSGLTVTLNVYFDFIGGFGGFVPSGSIS